MNFHGSNVVVTGGANGIGLAICRSIVAAGGRVWIFDVEAENPMDIAKGIGAQASIADVTDRLSLERAFAQVPRPDVVVVNAGTGGIASVDETTPERWNRTLAVNLTGAFQTLQIAGQRMKSARKGSIVLTASTNSFDGEPDLVATMPAKRACWESSTPLQMSGDLTEFVSMRCARG